MYSSIYFTTQKICLLPQQLISIVPLKHFYLLCKSFFKFFSVLHSNWPLFSTSVIWEITFLDFWSSYRWQQQLVYSSFGRCWILISFSFLGFPSVNVSCHKNSFFHLTSYLALSQCLSFSNPPHLSPLFTLSNISNYVSLIFSSSPIPGTLVIYSEFLQPKEISIIATTKPIAWMLLAQSCCCCCCSFFPESLGLLSPTFLVPYFYRCNEEMTIVAK